MAPRVAWAKMVMVDMERTAHVPELFRKQGGAELDMGCR